MAFPFTLGGSDLFGALPVARRAPPPSFVFKETAMSAAAEIFITVIGWTGALSNVAAYALVTAKRIAPDSLSFQGLNIFGAALLSVSASVYGAWPSAVVNVIWVVIGAYALYVFWRRHTATMATSAFASMTIDGSAGGTRRRPQLRSTP
jgi:hypothetical protein